MDHQYPSVRKYFVSIGQTIDYKIADFDIEHAITELKLGADKVDICLVDGFHTYDCTTRDLQPVVEI